MLELARGPVFASVVLLTSALLLQGCGQEGPSDNVVVLDVPSYSPEPIPKPMSESLRGTIAAFAAPWEAHQMALKVSRDGKGELFWRLYNSCDKDPAPCDDYQGNEIIPGGHAQLELDSVNDWTARGRIFESNLTSEVPNGPIVVSLDPKNHALDLTFLATREVPDGRIRFCGPAATAESCFAGA